MKSVALERPPPEAISNDGLWLDQDAFVEGAPNHRTRLFRVSLRHTQMYEVFVRDRSPLAPSRKVEAGKRPGSDVKDEDLDEESALAAFGSEFKKEAKHVPRDATHSENIRHRNATHSENICHRNAAHSKNICHRHEKRSQVSQGKIFHQPRCVQREKTTHEEFEFRIFRSSKYSRRRRFRVETHR